MEIKRNTEEISADLITYLESRNDVTKDHDPIISALWNGEVEQALRLAIPFPEVLAWIKEQI